MRFRNWFVSLSSVQVSWFYLALVLVLASTALHNPTAGYSRDQLYLPSVEVQTPFTSANKYYWYYYSGDSDRENGLCYLRLGPERTVLEASGIGADAIGVRMREEYAVYQQHKKADRDQEEKWKRTMEKSGWGRGTHWNAPLRKPKRWITDPRGWNSKGSFVLSWLPNLTNLWSYIVGISAILGLTGILGWLAGVRAMGYPDRSSGKGIPRATHASIEPNKAEMATPRKPSD